MYISTIIVAGGSGKRFGGKKQFFKLCGKPVVLWAIEKFKQASDEIILVLPEEDLNTFRMNPGFRGVKIVAGGKERWQSVKAGLNNISAKAGLVAIHDGARPLINLHDIRNCITAAKKYGAAICAAQASDTVKISDGKGRLPGINKTVDRKRIFLAQTPQVFRKEIILEAFEKNRLKNITDDAQMVEARGKKVKLVPVTSPNIKITTKTDLLVAEKLLKTQIRHHIK